MDTTKRLPPKLSARRLNERELLAAAECVTGLEWRSDALCAQTDPEAFYPEDERRWSEPAKRVCVGCPVVAQCLSYALLAGEPFGVWGGLTTDERALVSAALNGPRDGDAVSGCAA